MWQLQCKYGVDYTLYSTVVKCFGALALLELAPTMHAHAHAHPETDIGIHPRRRSPPAACLQSGLMRVHAVFMPARARSLSLSPLMCFNNLSAASAAGPCSIYTCIQIEPSRPQQRVNDRASSKDASQVKCGPFVATYYIISLPPEDFSKI